MDISRNKDFEFAILVETERFLRARYGANRQWQAGDGKRHRQDKSQKLTDLFHFLPSLSFLILYCIGPLKLAAD